MGDSEVIPYFSASLFPFLSSKGHAISLSTSPPCSGGFL